MFVQWYNTVATLTPSLGHTNLIFWFTSTATLFLEKKISKHKLFDDITN